MVLPPQSVAIKTSSNISDLTKTLSQILQGSSVILNEAKDSKYNMKTNLWTLPNPHICMSTKIWHPSHKVAPKASPFLYCYEKGQIRHRNERAVIGQFQKARLVGNLGYGCLVCHQTLDNLIRDLMS